MLGRNDTPQQSIVMTPSRSIVLFIAALLIASCGTSSRERNERHKKQQAENARQDSLAFKVATTPTLDCLPIFIAAEKGIFSSLGVDIRLKEQNAQMDCEEAFCKGKVECMNSDLQRTERLRRQGIHLDYLTSTNAYWQMIGNDKGRITDIKHMGDKMVGMSRYSATDYLSTLAIDSVKLDLPVFRIQVNDVIVRMMMLLNNELDAAMLTEPQATTARLQKHHVLSDSRHKDICLGVIAMQQHLDDDPHRKEQLDAFIKGYNMACDSVNEKGLGHYAEVISKYCHSNAATLHNLPHLSYRHTTPPRQKDIDYTKNVKWRTH